MTTLSAKQVASRIGTDAKTLRKYLRSPKSPFEPVGQGGRYDFDSTDLDEMARLFWKWAGKRHTRQEPLADAVNNRVEARAGRPMPTPNRDIDSRGNQRGSRGRSGSHVNREALDHDGNASRRRRERKAPNKPTPPAPTHNIHLDGPDLPPDKRPRLPNGQAASFEDDPWTYDPELDPLEGLVLDDDIVLDNDFDHLDDSIDDV